MLVVRPGQAGLRGVSIGNQDNLTIKDAEALFRQVPEVVEVSPVVSGSVQLKYFNRNSRTNMTGAAVTYFSIRNFEVARGRPFTESEVERRSRVAVLGPVTAENLFGATDPLGKSIKLNGINFKVVGILKAKGDQGWFSPDDQVLIPFSTAMKQVLGLQYLREIDLQVAQGADVNVVQEKAANVLRKMHRIQDGMEDDFNIRNQAEFIETASSFSRLFTFQLGGIASISLLVGGIGIMNIMLVTVTERTREIGVRKAIGARNRDILLQFLLESSLLSGLGGILGIVLGVGAAILIDTFTTFPTVLEPFSIILAFSFAVGIGVFFGFYPANRAAQLDPIVALRYE